MDLGRRRFLAITTATASGILIAGAPLISLPSNLVVQIAGRCSFCSELASETRHLAGKTGRPARICNQCVALCLEIIDEERRREPHPHEPPLPPEVLGELEERGLDADALARLLEPRRVRPMPKLACGFCGATKDEVPKLISGPDTMICDGCIAGAAALIS